MAMNQFFSYLGILSSLFATGYFAIKGNADAALWASITALAATLLMIRNQDCEKLQRKLNERGMP